MNHWDRTKKDWVLPVTAVCLVLGALLALQFRSQGATRLPGRADVLAQMLATVQARADAQADEISDLLGRAGPGRRGAEPAGDGGKGGAE